MSKSPKNLVICCDGTGNEFGSELAMRPDGTRTFENDNSNVVRLYTCLRVDESQVAYYHPGVGTMADPNRKWKIERWWSKVKGLAFGLGFTDNMADAYRFLMDNYATGDRIYLFGFSRGAYTVRALAGALNLYGLLCSGNEGHLSYLLRMYSDASQKAFKTLDHTVPRRLSETTQSRVFRETFSRQVTIHFMGVWDTVSSVGWVWDPVKLLYDGQNPIIRRGRHAISVDERRCFFQAMPWGRPMSLNDESLTAEARLKLEKALDPGWVKQDIVQAWFPGVHSDVGGSYRLSQSGPAITAFEWMLEEARERPNKHAAESPEAIAGQDTFPDGLKIEGDKELAVKGRASVFGGIRHWNYPQPKVHERLHESLCGAWWLLEFFPHKYFDEQGKKRWQLEPWPHNREIPDRSLIHPNLRRFLADPNLKYKPSNLDSAKVRDFTEADGADLHADALARIIGENYGIYRNPPKIKDTVPPSAPMPVDPAPPPSSL
ncbi:MAG: hypothetical protein NVSMB62_07430 [Acidobacteriaceae bacterium]